MGGRYRRELMDERDRMEPALEGDTFQGRNSSWGEEVGYIGVGSSREDLGFQGPEPGLEGWKGKPPSSSVRNGDLDLMGRGSEV